jgi:hypothetical protein
VTCLRTVQDLGDEVSSVWMPQMYWRYGSGCESHRGGRYRHGLVEDGEGETSLTRLSLQGIMPVRAWMQC